MIGLVLEGGGAKGAYHIGVFRALQELNIEIDGVVGTSIGSINGALIAQGDGEKAWQIWSQIHNSDVFAIRRDIERKLRARELSKQNIDYVAEKIRNILKRGGLDTSTMMNFLRKYIREEDIRKSDMDYGLVTVSLTAMKPLELLKEDIPSGEMLSYIMASASFPGFKTEKVDGQLFVDGGIWSNLPVNLLIDKGYEQLIAVRTHAVGRNRKIDTSFVNLFEIEPSEKLAPILDFNEASSTRDLNQGYYDTLRIFRGYRGRRYYIAPHKDPDWLLGTLARIEESKIENVANLLGFKGLPAKRMLFERILPRLAKIFGIPDTADYEDIGIMLFEDVARELGLPRFQVYELEEFLRTVKQLYLQDTTRSPSFLPDFVKSSPHLSKLAKKEVFGDILSIFFEERPDWG